MFKVLDFVPKESGAGLFNLHDRSRQVKNLPHLHRFYFRDKASYRHILRVDFGHGL